MDEVGEPRSGILHVEMEDLSSKMEKMESSPLLSTDEGTDLPPTIIEESIPEFEIPIDLPSGSQIENGENESIPKNKRGSGSPLKVCFNLLNTTLGAGCVTVPYAVYTLGVFAFFSSYCLFLLLQVNISHGGKLKSYSDIGYLVMKSWCIGKILECCIFCNTFGILAGYIVIVGEYSSSLIINWTSSEKEWLNDSFLGTEFMSFAVLFLLMFPLSLLRKVSFLSYTSVLGLLSVLLVTIIIIIRFFQLGSIPFENWDLEPTDFAEASTAIPLFIFSYSSHFVYLNLIAELGEDNLSIHVNSYVIFLVTLIATIIYIIIGTFGYLLFGGQIQDNVLMSFPDSDVFSQVGKLFILFVLIVSYPIIFFAARNSFLVLCCGEKRKRTNCCCWIFLSVILAILTWGIAAAVPMVSVVLGFTASTFFVVINFLVPFVAAMKTQKSWSMWIVHFVLCISFVVVGIVSTVGVVMDYIEKTFL